MYTTTSTHAHFIIDAHTFQTFIHSITGDVQFIPHLKITLAFDTVDAYLSTDFLHVCV